MKASTQELVVIVLVVLGVDLATATVAAEMERLLVEFCHHGGVV